MYCIKYLTIFKIARFFIKRLKVCNFFFNFASRKRVWPQRRYFFIKKLKKLKTQQMGYKSFKIKHYMEFPWKMPKYAVFFQKYQNMLFSCKMGKICKKYILGKKYFCGPYTKPCRMDILEQYPNTTKWNGGQGLKHTWARGVGKGLSMNFSSS